MSSTHEHLEHAEHAAHGGGHGDHGGHGDAGDQARLVPKIAITMAIIAALLAVVTMLSHRSHNEQLDQTIKSGRVATQRSVLVTKASDTWAAYQAKKIRSSQDQAFVDLLPVISREPRSSDVAVVTSKYAAEYARYTGDGDGELKDLSAKARELEREADQKLEESDELLESAHLAHERSNRFDLGELAVEIGLVLCSVGMLAKKRAFWYAAIAFALVGTGAALCGHLNVGIEVPHAATGASGGSGSEAPHEPGSKAEPPGEPKTPVAEHHAQ
jgi:hypothetical protein